VCNLAEYFQQGCLASWPMSAKLQPGTFLHTLNSWTEGCPLAARNAAGPVTSAAKNFEHVITLDALNCSKDAVLTSTKPSRSASKSATGAPAW
jgi:hypothetical protein